MDNLHPVEIQLQNRCHRPPTRKQILHAAGNNHAAMLGQFRQHCFRLQVRMLDARRAELPLNDEVRLREALRDIPFAHLVMHESVVLPVDFRRVRGERRLRIRHHRKRLIAHLDQLYGGFGDLPRPGGDHRQPISQVAHLVHCEDRLVLHHDADDLFPGNILRREHRLDSLQLPGLGCINAKDAGVRVCGAKDLAVKLVSGVVVGGELRPPRHLA